MKKLIISSVIIFSLIAPSVSFAQTQADLLAQVNELTITLLKLQIELLTKKVQELQAQLALIQDQANLTQQMVVFGQKNIDELGNEIDKVQANEISAPCVLAPDKMCKYPTTPISTPTRHIPTADEYPIAKFYFNGNELTGIKTNNMDVGDVSINLGRQFVKFGEPFTFSWNITQKDNHPLKCNGNSDKNVGSITETINQSSKSFNFRLSCYDNISGTLSSYVFQVLNE